MDDAIALAIAILQLVNVTMTVVAKLKKLWS